MFTNTAGELLRRTSFRTRIWKPAVRAAGLPERLRFHDLRHSYSTHLVSSGVPVDIVQYVMGHEHAETTLNLDTDVPPDFDRWVRRAFGADD